MRLFPSQQLAVLAAASLGGDAACALLAGDRPPLRLLADGAPRQVGAFFAWYASTIERDGASALVDDVSAFGRAVAAMRHPAVPAIVRATVRGTPDVFTMRDLALRSARECEAIQEEGWSILEALVYEQPAARGSVAADLGVALYGEDAA